MHQPSTDKPTQAQLKLPLMETLRDAGRPMRPAEVSETIAHRLALPTHVTQETVICGDGQETTLWPRHVRYTREKLKVDGYVYSPRYGLWDLTDEGQEALRQKKTGLVVTLAYRQDGSLLGAQIEMTGVIPTLHTLRHGDARDLSFLDSESIGLVISSPPYADLKRYDDVPGQLGHIESYEEFLLALDLVWKECYRVLKPGGHMALVVGDVLRSRARYGAHQVLPLTDDLRSRIRRHAGFHALNGLVWQKFGNIHYEEGKGGRLGQVGMPNNVVKMEHERILLFRKPGSYSSFAPEIRDLSRISDEEYQRWYRGAWTDIPGASTRKGHPAPFPVEVPYRLIRMFSYVSETVLDMFAGHFNTAQAAMKAQRHSIGIEISPNYLGLGIEEAARAANRLAA